VSTATIITPMAGAAIAAALDRGQLFTDLAARLTGEEITFHRAASPPVCTLTAAERGPLRAKPGTQGIPRTGILRTAGGRDIARVTAVYLPYRIPDEAALRSLYMTSTPMGTVLAPLGCTRQSLGAMIITTGDIAVRSRGLLLIGGVPVALTGEQVLRTFAAGLR